MKRNTMLFLLVLLSWSGLSWSGLSWSQAAPNQIDVTGQFQVTQSGLVLNRTTKTYNSTVTLTNTSNVVVTGPLSVSVNSLSPNTVTLANATGASSTGVTVNVLTAQQSMKPGDSIKGIVLAFNNPGNVKFNFTTSVLGNINPQATALNVNAMQPTSGYSSTLVTLTGNNFTQNSVIKFGNTTIQDVDYISSQQLQFVVPLDANQNGHLVPLASGLYPVSVDGGISNNFTVTALPANPNPAGQVINDVINNLSTFVAQNQTTYQTAIADLISQTSDANLLAALNNLSGLNVTFMQLLTTDLPNAIAALDSESLDTLERLLVLNQASSIKLARASDYMMPLKNNASTDLAILFKVFGIKEANAAPTTCATSDPATAGDPTCGDAFLDSQARMLMVNHAKFNSVLGKISKASNVLKVLGVVNPEVLAVVAVIKVSSSVSDIFNNIIAYEIGSITNFSLNVTPQGNGTSSSIINYPRPLPSISTKSFLSQIKLLVSNDDLDMGAVKTFIAPSITVSHNLDLISILNKVFNILPIPSSFNDAKAAASIMSTVKSVMVKYFNVNPNALTIPSPTIPPQSLLITLDRLEWDDNINPLMLSTVSALSPNTFAACDYLSPAKNYISINNSHPGTNYGNITVSNNIPTPANSYLTANCAARVASKYTTKTEQYFYAETDFQIKKYNEVKVNISGTGTVTSNETSTPYNQANSNLDCTSACTGFFDMASYKTVTLIAIAPSGETFTGWSGNCQLSSTTVDNDTCTITLDGNTQNLTASFGQQNPQNPQGPTPNYILKPVQDIINQSGLNIINAIDICMKNGSNWWWIYNNNWGSQEYACEPLGGVSISSTHYVKLLMTAPNEIIQSVDLTTGLSMFYGNIVMGIVIGHYDNGEVVDFYYYALDIQPYNDYKIYGLCDGGGSLIPNMGYAVVWLFPRPVLDEGGCAIPIK